MLSDLLEGFLEGLLTSYIKMLLGHHLSNVRLPKLLYVKQQHRALITEVWHIQLLLFATFGITYSCSFLVEKAVVKW